MSAVSLQEWLEWAVSPDGGPCVYQVHGRHPGDCALGLALDAAPQGMEEESFSGNDVPTQL